MDGFDTVKEWLFSLVNKPYFDDDYKTRIQNMKTVEELQIAASDITGFRNRCNIKLLIEVINNSLKLQASESFNNRQNVVEEAAISSSNSFPNNLNAEELESFQWHVFEYLRNNLKVTIDLKIDDDGYSKSDRVTISIELKNPQSGKYEDVDDDSVNIY